MTRLFSKNVPALRTVTAGLALVVILAGCPEPEIVIEWPFNDLAVQITVQNEPSKSVVLWPAYGRKADSDYQWAIGPVPFPPNGNQEVLTAIIAEYAYEGHQPGDVILSFMLEIDGKGYAGWDAKYGTGGISGKPLEGQGYGYVVLCETSGSPGWHSSLPLEQEPDNAANSEFVTARYTVTITDTNAAFVLDEVVFGHEQRDLP